MVNSHILDVELAWINLFLKINSGGTLEARGKRTFQNQRKRTVRPPFSSLPGHPAYRRGLS